MNMLVKHENHHKEHLGHAFKIQLEITNWSMSLLAPCLLIQATFLLLDCSHLTGTGTH